MARVQLALIGIGSNRFGPAVLGSIAGYFGERPLELRLYDADLERLELYVMLARRLLKGRSDAFSLSASDDLSEVLDQAQGVIACATPRCWALYSNRTQLCEDVLCLKLGDWTSIRAIDFALAPISEPKDWPEKLDEEDWRGSHQTLRWILADDDLGELVELHRGSPVYAWLDRLVQSSAAAERT